MRKIKLYIAMSLNGKIADKNGNVDWLESIPNPDKTDYGYEEFYSSVDTTIMGFSTYDQIMSWDIDFPYTGKKNYVLTRSGEHQDTDDAEFISENHIEILNNLKQEEGKDIWLIGGGQVNTLLLNAGLVDELRLFVMPIVLSEGIELFAGIPDQTELKLIKSINYTSGAVELQYQVIF